MTPLQWKAFLENKHGTSMSPYQIISIYDIEQILLDGHKQGVEWERATKIEPSPEIKTGLPPPPPWSSLL